MLSGSLICNRIPENVSRHATKHPTKKDCHIGSPFFIRSLLTHKATQFLNGFGFNLADTLSGNAVFGSQLV